MSTSIRIFLTGTIAPMAVPNLKRTNALDREMDYFSSIKKWLSYGIGVTFCENSNYNSEVIENLANDHEVLEIIKYKSNVSYLGKGHGEIELFEYAMLNSRYLSTSDYIIKVTGRYSIANFEKIYSWLLGTKPFDISVILSRKLKWADSRFFIFTPKFYALYMCKNINRIDESAGVYFEHVLSFSTHSCLANNGRWEILPEIPIIKGFYGSKNTVYRVSLIKRAKYYLYHVVRKFIYNSGV